MLSADVSCPPAAAILWIPIDRSSGLWDEIASATMCTVYYNPDKRQAVRAGQEITKGVVETGLGAQIFRRKAQHAPPGMHVASAPHGR